jgi:hypothetical protein
VGLGIEHVVVKEVCSWFLQGFDETPYSADSEGYEKSVFRNQQLGKVRRGT